MLDSHQTKKLLIATNKLHQLNLKYKALEIEESVFIVNKQDMVEKKLKVSADIREALCLIDECMR